MEIDFRLSQEQKQVLSLQQAESLEILSMNAQDLSEFISSEGEENPLLVFAHEGEPLRTVSYCAEENDALLNLPAPEQTTASDILLSQIDLARCDPEREGALRCVAELIDFNGFLTVTPEEASAVSHIAIDEIREAVRVLQGLEPAGVCASSLRECLWLQLKRNGREDEIFRKLIEGHLENIAYGRVKMVARDLEIDVFEIRRRIREICALNPKPLNGYIGDRPQYVIPDVILSYAGHVWHAELNDNWYGNLAINDFYAKMAASTADEDLREYFKSKLQRIRFINDAVERRRSTLIRLTERIASYQAGFLLEGKPILPLTMTHLAEELGTHVSTISRAVHGKYLQYPHGVCEMRSLFSISLPLKEREDTGRTRGDAKRIIRRIIDSEDHASPCSDAQIVSMLKREGIDISRRTVAKYRGELGIRGTADRRVIPQFALRLNGSSTKKRTQSAI